MDTAKAIGIIIANPEFADVRSLEGVAPTRNHAVPTIAVPTTAGTAAVEAVRRLSADVGIPDKNDKVREEDLDILAADAFADACRPGNPRETSVEELKELYRKIM